MTRPHGTAWIAATAGVILLTGAAVFWPLARAFASFRGQASLAVDIPLLARSLGIAALIAALALILSLPGAWIVRRSRRSAVILLMAPMLFPSYLAYTGWGVLRAPDTALGRWLMMGPAGTGPSDAANWYPTAAGYVLAVLGLALWGWPLAALALGIRLRRIDDAVFDSLHLDGSSRARATLELGTMCRGSLLAAAALVALVMLGSAIPLHLAQFDTYAVRLWRILDQTPATEKWRVWIAAWPLVAIAIFASAAITTRIKGLDAQAPTHPKPASRAPVLALIVWAMAVVGPVVLLAANIKNWSGAVTSLRLLRSPLVTSALVAAAVGALGVILAIWSWVSCAGRGAKAATWIGASLLTCGLLPGVLVGSATVRAWVGTAVGDSLLVVILAHTARFGFVGVLAGWWLAATEATSDRDMRTLDAGSSIRGWFESSVLRQAGAIAAAAVGMAFLSFHEIESTVLVQPASSTGGSFAWQMLQWLHFARMDELGMGVLAVVGLGVLAGAAVVLIWRNRD